MKSALTIPTNIPALMSATVQEVYKADDLFMMDIDKLAEDAIKVLDSRSLSVILVSRQQQVVGIVTTTDILFKILSNGGDPARLRLGEIMTAPILSVEPVATVQHALSLMDTNNVRQVCVSSSGRVLGILHREDIFDKMHLMTNSITSAKPTCPYCNSHFVSKDSLSSHIEMEHIAEDLPKIEARLHYRKSN